MNNLPMEQNQNKNPESPSVSPPRFRGQVLNRIYRVWLFRKLAPVLLGEILLLSLLVYGFGRLVFVQRVIENAANVFFRDPSGIFSFGIAAFLRAPAGTKLIVVGAIILAALVIRLVTQGILRFILVKENYFRQIPK